VHRKCGARPKTARLLIVNRFLICRHTLVASLLVSILSCQGAGRSGDEAAPAVGAGEAVRSAERDRPEVARWFPQEGTDWPGWIQLDIRNFQYHGQIFTDYHEYLREVYVRGSGEVLSVTEEAAIMEIAFLVLNYEGVFQSPEEEQAQRDWINSLPSDENGVDGTAYQIQQLTINREIVKRVDEKLGDGRITEIYLLTYPMSAQ
jgi:hypothetical protein